MKAKAHVTQEEYYRGVRMRPYDLVKELTYALVGIAALTLVLAAVLSSPDVPPVTIAGWAQTDPVDFVTTATSELQGSTTSAGYGAPYNNAGGEQSWGPIAPQIWFGQRIPVDSAGAFVIQPLKTASYGNSELGTALSQWDSANADQQTAWLSAYADALGKATVKDAKVAVADGDYGIIGVIGGTAGLGIIILMTALTVALALVPLMPVLRDIPRWLPIHRLSWKEYYTAKKRSA